MCVVYSVHYHSDQCALCRTAEMHQTLKNSHKVFIKKSGGGAASNKTVYRRV